MTAQRDYYARRVGSPSERPQLTLAEVASQIAAAFRTIDSNGYLQRSFGYDCVDAGEVPGLVGTDLRVEHYLRTGIRIEGNVSEAIKSADEITLFTMIEFIHDHVAKPGEGAGHNHTWNSCGFHVDPNDKRFNEKKARAEWRDKVNSGLRFYDGGYELSENGEIIQIASQGMERLIAAAPAARSEPANASKLANAVHTFQLGRSTREQRKQAVRELVDILEYHRDVVKTTMSKDESDLFIIANKFALRHHKATQQDDYDDAWLTWLFYVYLATAHLVLGRASGTAAFAEVSGVASNAPPDIEDIPF